jgi:hypothetical protein
VTTEAESVVPKSEPNPLRGFGFGDLVHRAETGRFGRIRKFGLVRVISPDPASSTPVAGPESSAGQGGV